MVSMKPKTAKQSVDMVDLVIIEVDEFIACLEFDMADGSFRVRE